MINTIISLLDKNNIIANMFTWLHKYKDWRKQMDKEFEENLKEECSRELTDDEKEELYNSVP